MSESEQLSTEYQELWSRHSPEFLPPGIYYEKARQRFRVRLYKNHRILHRSYHKSWPSALRSYIEAKRLQRESPRELPVVPPTTSALVQQLQR